MYELKDHVINYAVTPCTDHYIILYIHISFSTYMHTSKESTQKQQFHYKTKGENNLDVQNIYN